MKNKSIELDVDFTVLDKPWSDEERKEFSAFIKLRKEQRKKRASQPASSKRDNSTTARTRVGA